MFAWKAGQVGLQRRGGEVVPGVVRAGGT